MTRIRPEDQTAERQLELVIAAKAGDKRAMEELLRITGPVAISIINRIDLTRYSWDAYNDLKQVAMVGLLEAVRDFDPEYGVKFWTYAYYKVRKEAFLWVAKNSGALPMPPGAWRTAGMVDDLEAEYERYLTREELKEATGKGYARDAVTARASYVSLDFVEKAQEEETIENDIIEYTLELVNMAPNKRLSAALHFCDQYGVDFSIGRKMVEYANNAAPEEK